MSVMLSAASVLTWATATLGLPDVPELLREAQRLRSDEQQQAPLFLPYLNGERSPHNDPLATAAWAGMRTEHGRLHLAYAAVEGVGFGLLDGLRTFPAANPALSRLSLVGGGSRSAWWAQLLADTLGLTLTVHQDGASGAALGAARLGWLCAGGTEERVCITPPVVQIYTPEVSRQATLAQRHERFQALSTANPTKANLNRRPGLAPLFNT